MKSNNKNYFLTLQRLCYYKIGFSLVELLVVVAILAILGVVAYQAFGGQTAKARDSRRIQDLATIEGALQVFYQEKNYFPMPSTKGVGTDNLWGYNDSVGPSIPASRSNQLKVVYSGEEISAIVTADTKGGGRVLDTTGAKQVGAKGVIDGSVLLPSRLSKVPSDPGISNIKIGTDKTFAVDYGLGKYVYAVYSIPAIEADWNKNGRKAIAYQLAATLEKENDPTTYIIGNYDKSLENDLPDSLIGTGNNTIPDGSKQNANPTTSDDQGIPYPVNNFAE